MKTRNRLLPLLPVAVAVLGLQSCQDWGKWDDVAGNQQMPPPDPVVLPITYANVSDPTIGLDAGKYYIISSNASIDDLEYQNGLMFRSSPDLFNFDPITEDNIYILSSVIEDWAGARLKELDPAVEDGNIKIGQPCLRKAGDEWRLYYSVSGGTNASIIGYATSDTPSGEWLDKGEVMTSDLRSAYKAFSPSFFTSIDGVANYMAFGDGASGIYITELDRTTSIPVGTPTLVAKNSSGHPISAPCVFVNENRYVMLFTMLTGSDVSRTYQVSSLTPLSDYTDINSRSSIFADQWALTSIISDYKLPGSDQSWLNVGGVDVIWSDNNNSFAVNSAKANGVGQPSLQIRRMFNVVDSRRSQSPEKPLMGLSPEEYMGPVSVSFTTEDFTGDWYYGTQWAHMVNGMSDAMTFAADGTYSGGSSGKWDYNQSTNILHLNSTSWSGEDMYLYCYAETDNVNGGITLVACGYNDTFSDYPGAWMKKGVPLGAEPVVENRSGYYAPTMAKENGLYYIISGNAETDGYDYQNGLVVTTSDDLAFFDNSGYILSDVANGWAAAKIRELDSQVSGDAIFTIDYPCLKKVDNKWRIYYSVTSNESAAAVIGYAESNSLNSDWNDMGLVLASTSGDPYRAVSPSFCAAPGNNGHYMAFGDNGIYIVELDQIDGSALGDPVNVVSTTIETGYPELFYANGTFNLYYSIFNTCINQASALHPMGPYSSYGNRECMDILEWWTGRILTPYYWETGKRWNGTYGGISVCEDGDKWLVVHQASIQNEDDYQLHVREMAWLTYDRPDDTTSDWQQFPAICPERYTMDTDQNITREEVMAKSWNQFVFWRVDANGINGCDAPYILLYEDGTNSLTGENGEATWEYDEKSHMLHIFSSAWNEHLYLYVFRVNNFDNADGQNVLVASGINHTFADKTGTWMKQATE